MTRCHSGSGKTLRVITMPDAIKRTADDVFWIEWAAVTAYTRELLLMYAEHSIMLTVNPQKLAEAIHQAEVRRQRKKGG